MKNAIRIIAAILYLSFIAYLFDVKGGTNWLPWTLFLVPFIFSILFFNGVFGTLFGSKTKVVDASTVHPLESESTSAEATFEAKQQFPIRNNKGEIVAITIDPNKSTNRHEI